MKRKFVLPDTSAKELSIQPLERSETIPSTWYTDPRFFEVDKKAILSNTWQGIGHISRLRNAGDQIVGIVAGNPILVVRGQDGIVRAFYNVCRHRGGPLALEDCSTKVLQCKYHGWTYLLDGSLRGTPRFDRTELFDKKDFGLIPVQLQTWEGFLFVNLARKATGLQSTLKDIKERILPISLATKKFYRRISYQVNSNWKVYVDNYLEGYHLPYVHPELCNLLDYQNYVTETFDYYSLQYSPIQEKGNFYGSNNSSAFYFFVWPNFMLNILPGRLQTNLVIPSSHNCCTVLFDYYYDDVESAEGRKVIEEDIQYSDKVQKEDAEICEHVQRGLESAAYHKGRFSVDMENGVYHFQTLLKKAYRSFFQT
ncbi:MAG: aromatic ring-hydroxylating dioxygenase subunit alpha [Ignavibacteriales bacterium]|nr:aromatic ring-hydroxylating dioxygenase subunit alpha [Ignavibacteriales bacterium]